MKYNTRFAPSPTGDLHLGNLRTGYFNWLTARASGGNFILRIDDTDIERSKPEHTQIILDTFDWLGLDYDEIFYQSQRFDRYNSMARALVSLKAAKELSNGAIALTDKVLDVLPNKWHDEIVGDVEITDKVVEQIKGLILIKGDGSPTYNWSCVIDDHDFGINYICRGSDHISNTPKQLACYYALAGIGAENILPKFAHIGLIHHQKKKLSKRDGAASVLYYKEQGYDPEAVLNFMLRLGWGPTVDDKTTKMISRDRAVELFVDGGSMRASSANMDLNMLESFDRKYKAKKNIWRTKEKLINE